MQNISITTAKHFQKLSQILELVISISCFRDAEIPKKKSTKYKKKKRIFQKPQRLVALLIPYYLLLQK